MYEVLNIRSLKQATPNLVVINMWGVSFVDDAHIEAFSSNCIQLAVMCVSYCPKVPHFVNRVPFKVILDDLEGRNMQSPQQSSYIQKPRSIRMKPKSYYTYSNFLPVLSRDSISRLPIRVGE